MDEPLSVSASTPPPRQQTSAPPVIPKLGVGLFGGRTVSELVDEAAGHRRREERVTASHDTDTSDEIDGVRSLEQEAAGACAQGFIHVLINLEGGQHQHSRGLLPAESGDPPGGFQPIHFGHLDVHEHDIRIELLRELDRLGAVSGLANDLEVGFGLEYQAEARPHELLVVSQQHAHRHARPPLSGSLAWTRKPPSSRGPALSSPPNRLTRSFIPMRPRPRPSDHRRRHRKHAGHHRRSGVQTVGAVTYVDAGVGQMRVLERVRQRLWMIRYAERSMLAGSSTGGPSTVTATIAPPVRRARRAFDVAQTRLRAQRFVSHFRCRKHPSIRSMSVSACRPVDSMEASVSRTVSGLDSEDAALRPMDHDQVESVSHDIVKLSGDARTLVGNGSRALTSRSRSGRAARSSTTSVYARRLRA